MDQKKDHNQSEYEVIDENQVIENLFNGEDMDGKPKFQSHSAGPQVVYTK